MRLQPHGLDKVLPEERDRWMSGTYGCCNSRYIWLYRPSSAPHPPGIKVYILYFESAPEAFNPGVVPAASPAVHADSYTQFL